MKGILTEVSVIIMEFLRGSCIFILGSLVARIGGFDNTLKALLIFMTIDFITGLIKGGKNRNVSSGRAYHGGIKKSIMLLIVIVAHTIDGLAGFVGESMNFRSIIILYYLGMEGISIIENAEAIGIPVHSKLKNILETYTKTEGGK